MDEFEEDIYPLGFENYIKQRDEIEQPEALITAQELEKKLGFKLPKELIQILKESKNSVYGFYNPNKLLWHYRALSEVPNTWPRGMLKLSDGCGTGFTCVYCFEKGFPIYYWDSDNAQISDHPNEIEVDDEINDWYEKQMEKYNSTSLKDPVWEKDFSNFKDYLETIKKEM